MLKDPNLVQGSDQKPKIWIVIPAFNESKQIAEVVRQLIPDYENILVVDDGSSDNTCALAQAAGAHTHRLEKNLGQGGALRAGIRQVLDRGADVVVTFDADGQHSASDIPGLLRPVLEENIQVSLGSRFKGNTVAMPFVHRLKVSLAVSVVRLFYRLDLSDAHNGLRSFRRDAAEKIHIGTNRREHASEIIHEIAKHHLSYQEVPVVIRYFNEESARLASWGECVRVFIWMVRRYFQKK